MFMDKVEWGNSVHLLKVRKKQCVGIRNIFLFLVLMFAMDLFALIQETFTYATEVRWLTPQVYSLTGFFLMMIACVHYTLGYKAYNHSIQIFPQSNKSRFTSYELFCYISFLKIQLAALGLYFVQYGISLILSLIKGNIEFAYQFSLQFIIAGFMVNLMYGFVAIAFVILIGTLDRKFKWIARIIIAVAIIIGRIYPDYSLHLLGNVIHIITRESSILLFLIKTICLWIILVCIYHVIDKHTKYFEVEKKFFHPARLIAIAAIILITYVLIAYLSLSSYSYTSVTKISTEEATKQKNRQMPEEEIESIIDISNMPEGTELKIVVSEEDKEKYNISLREVITNASNDKIIIKFNPTHKMVDWTNMNLFTEPKLETKLEDYTLYLDVTSAQNVKVLFFTPYSFMWQFDYFMGKHIFQEQPGSRGGSGTGSIIIYLPEDKKLSILDFDN